MFEQRQGEKWQPVVADPAHEGRVVADVFAVSDGGATDARLHLLTTEAPGRLTLDFEAMMAHAPDGLLEQNGGIALEVHLSGYASFTVKENDGDYGTVLLRYRNEDERRADVAGMEGKFDGRDAYGQHALEQEMAQAEG